MGLLTIVMAATLSVGFMACDPDPDPELNVSPEKLDFGQNADSKPFAITSNVGWTVSANKDWITINQPSGSDNGSVYVDVEENKEFSDRSGRVTITASKGGIVRYVEVKQAGITPILEVSPTSPSTVNGGGGTLSFQITANVNWSVSSSDGWLTLNPSVGSGNGSVMATIAANASSSTRSATLTFSGEGNASPIRVTISQEPGGISVSPTSASLLCDKGSTTNITVSATGSWELKGCPDWLHASALSGVGNTQLVLTALNENWSDEERSATLTFTSNSLSATCMVSQLPSLPPDLRVELTNETLSSDGFAYDMAFGSAAKGYKEAFLTEAKYLTMTDRDLYNELMSHTEYDKLDNYTFLPAAVYPGTKLIYCVAAYGNENNPDGTHKYGPITIKRIITKQQTPEDDMVLSSTYNSTEWKVITERKGNYGQKCEEYYILGSESLADYFLEIWLNYCDACLMHLYFKPMIENNQGYKNGPQTSTWKRTGDKFFCTAWGIDKDTKKFSAELSTPVYRDLSSDSSRELKRHATSQAELNKPHSRPSKADIDKLCNSLRLYKAK